MINHIFLNSDASESFIQTNVDELVSEKGIEAKSRAYRMANELRNSLNLVMRGQRNGRRYNVPGTGRMKYFRRGDKKGTAQITYKKYTASAPGEVPAVRTGAFRGGWTTKTIAESTGSSPHNFNVRGIIESDLRLKNGALLGEYLENGTPNGKMDARPYKQRTIDNALPKIIRIIANPY